MPLLPVVLGVNLVDEITGLSNKNPDPIAEHYGHSIYHRFDYIVNSDMSIPFALGSSFMYHVNDELAKRTGLPQQDRRPQRTPLTLYPPTMPKGK